MRNVCVCLVALLLISQTIRAEDEAALATGLADTASQYAAKGKLEEAKNWYFKALFHDENCGPALYELAKIYENAGDSVNALNFFVRASQQLAGAGDPLSKAKGKDCDKHILKLSPFTTQMNTMMEDYAQELGKIAAKSQDTVTLEEAETKITLLNLSQRVPPDKMPDSLKDLAKLKKDKDQAKNAKKDQRYPWDQESKPAPANLTPDIERALKAGGWTSITGTWKKKSDGVYEVTDGKIEAQIVNGAMQLIVQKGGTGTVRMFCRASAHSFMDEPGMVSSKDATRWPSGFGYIIKDGEAKRYIPTGNWTDGENNNLPDLDKTINLGAAPKNMFTVSVTDNKLDVSENGANPRHSTMRITHDGPFTISIIGTMTIETPQAKGF